MLMIITYFFDIFSGHYRILVNNAKWKSEVIDHGTNYAIQIEMPMLDLQF